MSEMTTVQLNKSVLESLKKIKKHPRQTYNELIAQLIENLKKSNHYDEFLHKIQQSKMQELWDNKEDEEWERA